MARHGGAVVKTMGDGVMASFSTVDNALAAAIDMQREIGGWSGSLGIDPPLQLKIGVHRWTVGALRQFGLLATLCHRLPAVLCSQVP